MTNKIENYDKVMKRISKRVKRYENKHDKRIRQETIAEVEKMIDKFDFANRVIIEDINTENNNQMDKRLKKELKQKLQEMKQK